jgi:N utilization substance protein B
MAATPRHRAREAALQVLYFWEIGRVEPGEALDTFFREHKTDEAGDVREFAGTLVHGTIASLVELDRVIEQHSANWRLERLAVIDRLILRMAIWELKHEPGIDAAVVLNEAIELARTFGNDDSVRFVNGVLDAVKKTLQGSGTGH